MTGLFVTSSQGIKLGHEQKNQVGKCIFVVENASFNYPVYP